MNLYSLSLLFFSFGVLLVAVLALVKRKDFIAIRFLIFSIAIFGWGIMEAYWFSQIYPQPTGLRLMRVSNAFAIWIPIAWLHFVLSFVGKKEPLKYFYVINYIMALFLTAFSQTPFFISGTHTILHFKYYTSPGPLFHLFAVNFFTMVPLAFGYLLKAYSLNDERKGQLKCIIIAAIFGFSAGSTTFLPVYKIASPFYPLPLIVLYPFFMGIALIRYGLFDIQEIADAFQREKMTALGIMAASLNHEIRNPLYIAKGRIETYLDGVERKVYQTPEVRQTSADTVLNSASNQLQRAMDIMQRFSDFAKPFNVEKDKQTVALEPLMRDVRELVSHELETRNITLKETLQPGLQIQGNRRQIEEVLVNLMMNAIQAIKQAASCELQAKTKEKLQATQQVASHGPQAEANAGPQLEACGLQPVSPVASFIEISADQLKGSVRIQIKGNGPGIEPERLARIFEPFYTTKEEGTGLGLYITKQLVERNEGKIEVRSKEGLGTVFIVTFRAPLEQKSIQK